MPSQIRYGQRSIEKYRMDEWVEASGFFRESGQEITELCKTALEKDKKKVSNTSMGIANIEERTYFSIENRSSRVGSHRRA